MDITPEMMTKLMSFILAHYPGGQLYCSMCLGKNVVISNQILQLPLFHQDAGLVIGGAGGRRMPLVAVLCKDCASVSFISAVLAGLVKGVAENEHNGDK